MGVSFCVNCGKKTKDVPNSEEHMKSKNGRPMIRSVCSVCKRIKTRFIDIVREAGSGVLNWALNKIPLPEMHLSHPTGEHIPSGSFNKRTYSYCGPFTKLDKRQKEGYRGVNKLDRACLRHDIAYSKYKDTAERNVADDILAKESMDIVNDPSIPEYEKNDARKVAAIMATKSKFGLGTKNSKILLGKKNGKKN
jgi:hypothetical protein